ncbi:single-stranded-DNA-specific exonuclease RecJ [Bacillus sp. M6-12]|uniref:single-stranded-DNA-specific exonuclease RecJ n=1 Tax=Bacillus sp. M6-12 TaxID=2054166 RepID=UPI000C773C20|nr:single-stranded-DNA-specific exonuclease RecJ [Bacillus sp. M6-12]PLS17622.1 single-stranded-DNA-specific exonuclease RecJ [Bacillus sp. M6-12]
MEWTPFDSPLEEHPDRAHITYLARSFCIEPVFMHHLYVHGIKDEEDLSLFLFPSLNDLHDPFLLNDMKKAIYRIARAIKQKENILIFGDYDVDGISSSTLLYQALKMFKANVYFRLPIRSEGYGLSPMAVDKLPDDIALIITVDNGSSAHPALEVAKRKGIDVIVTDHHDILGAHPKCLAFINPKRSDNTYPFTGLAGAGVALKVVQALFMAAKIDWAPYAHQFLELATLGTIADLMPLKGENRVICWFGLKKMNTDPQPVLKKLFKMLKINYVDSSTIGFQIGPIFNSCGRIDDPNKAVRTLINPCPTDQELYQLIKLNKKRQEMTKVQFNRVAKKIVENEWYKQKVIVVNDDFDNGIIGIIAARITSTFKRPAIVISKTGTGSARSVNGTDFSIINVIQKCSGHLTKYGGHKAAAGLSMDLKQFNEFNLAIQRAAVEEAPIRPKVNYIGKVPLHQFPIHLFDDLVALEPFGMAFPKPLFYSSPIVIRQYQTFGKNNEHLKINVKRKEANAFFKGSFLPQLQRAPLTEFLYTPNCIKKKDFLIHDLRNAK